MSAVSATIAGSQAAIINESFRAEPSLANNSLVRLVAITLAIPMSVWGSAHVSTKMATALHLASFGTHFGTMVWVSFSLCWLSKAVYFKHQYLYLAKPTTNTEPMELGSYPSAPTRIAEPLERTFQEHELLFPFPAWDCPSSCGSTNRMRHYRPSSLQIYSEER